MEKTVGIKVELKHTLIHITADCKEGLAKLASFPYAQMERAGHFTMPCDPVMLKHLEYHKGEVPLTMDGIKYRKQVEYKPIDWKHSLFEYQVDGANFLRKKKRCILADETGLGKTRQTIEAARDKHTLIVAPLNKCQDWIDAIEKRYGNGSALKAFGTSKLYKRLEVDAYTQKYGTHFVVTNYENVNRKFHQLFASNWDCIVLEEAHYVQNRDSNRTKLLNSLINRGMRPIENVWMLTATPIWNEPNTVWSLLNILNPSRFSSYWRFVNTFCNIRETKFSREIIGAKQETLPVFKEILADYVLRREKSQVLDLPPREEHLVYLNVDTAVKVQNRWLRKQMREEEGHVNLSKLRFHLLEYGVKKKALHDILKKEQGKKVLVFVKYRASAALVMDWLKDDDLRGILGYINDVPITGDVSMQDREQMIKDFWNSKKGGVLLGTAKCMGTGIDLHCASVIIFIEHPHLFSELDQCCGRIERIGTTKTPTYYHLIQKGTIDEKVWLKCMSRSLTAEGILDEL